MATNRNNSVKQTSDSKYSHVGQLDEYELETYTSAADMEGSSTNHSHYKSHNQKLNDDPIADIILVWYRKLQSEAL